MVTAHVAGGEDGDQGTHDPDYQGHDNRQIVDKEVPGGFGDRGIEGKIAGEDFEFRGQKYKILEIT